MRFLLALFLDLHTFLANLRQHFDKMSVLVAPSLLASDFANLEREVKMINESEADWIHIDIMDGVFVPNISIGIPVVEAIKRHAKKVMDVHLMIINPERYIDAFRKAGADVISIHIEACPQLNQQLEKIRSTGAKAGIAINPYTPASSLQSVIEKADVVNVMGVNPGFGGQKIIASTFEKVKQIKELIVRTGSSALIEIDGGVNENNAKPLTDAGVDVLVAGNFVFSSSDPKAVIHTLKSVR